MAEHSTAASNGAGSKKLNGAGLDFSNESQSRPPSLKYLSQMNSFSFIHKTAGVPKKMVPHQRIFRVLGFALLASALTGVLTSSHAAEPNPQHHATDLMEARNVEQTLRHIFERPNSPLTVKPISIEGDFAVAGWMQNGTGGRTLLKRQHGEWQIALCGDAGLVEPANLEKMGLSHSAAAGLAEKIKAAESCLTDQERIQISKFHGVMQISEGSEHPAPR
jgi:hypothetical protein